MDDASAWPPLPGRPRKRGLGWDGLAAALGIAMALSLVGCSPVAAPSACSLLFIDGHLVADDGRVVLLPGPSFAAWGRRVPLDWPAGWTVRPIDEGQLEVVDGTGGVRARTGAGIVLSAVNDPAGSGALFRDGELVVCPGEWPDNYMDPDHVEPDADVGAAP
jgi:hypothetical protein